VHTLITGLLPWLESAPAPSCFTHEDITIKINHKNIHTEAESSSIKQENSPKNTQIAVETTAPPVGVPLTLVTQPTLATEPPIVPRSTKPSFDQTIMSSVSPSVLTPHTRQLVDTLYEGKESVPEQDKQVAPTVDDKEVYRGRTLTTMPSVSDFVSPNPSPTRDHSPYKSTPIRTSRPVDQEFYRLKVEGFYLKPHHLVIPKGGFAYVVKNSPTYISFYISSHIAAQVRCDHEFDGTELPFTDRSTQWILRSGSYDFPEFGMKVRVPANSTHTIESYIPFESDHIW
jgi:hypothetical protein